MSRVVVVGGGVSGLAVAYELTRRARSSADLTSDSVPVEVLCFEAGYAPGGSVQTQAVDGFLLESGPIGFRYASRGVRTLIRQLNLAPGRVAASPEAANYHIFRAGKLRRIPRSAREFVSGDLLPPAAMLRALAEPLARAGDIPGDESVEAFARRRLGRAGTLLADALATAICAGDARRMSMSSAFPALRSMESDHGSLFRALRAATTGATSAPLCSFERGLAELTRALADEIGSGLRLGIGVCAVNGMGARGYRVLLEEGQPLDADAIVLACSASDAAAVVGDWDPELAQALGEIPAARVARVHLGYRDAALMPWPQGSGFVVPRDQGLRMLGTELTSSVFPGRAPDQSRLLTVTFGGIRDPSALDLDDDTLIATAKAELGRVMGLVAGPYLTRVARPAAGIPQYEVGHGERLACIQRRLDLAPGLHVSGSSYRALELGACLDEASVVAEDVLKAVGSHISTFQSTEPVGC